MEEMEDEVKRRKQASMIDLESSPGKNGEKSDEQGSIYEKIEEKKEENDHDEARKRRAGAGMRSINGRIRVKSIRNAQLNSKRLSEKYNERSQTIPKPEMKLYKKSMENYYFTTNSHPARDDREQRGQKFWSQFNFSSTQILKQQISHEHWASGFNEAIADVGQKLKMARNSKTPLENFSRRDDSCKLSPVMRNGVRSSVPKQKVNGS